MPKKMYLVEVTPCVFMFNDFNVFKYITMQKLIYNRYLGELWLWMIFLEWFYSIW